MPEKLAGAGEPNFYVPETIKDKEIDVRRKAFGKVLNDLSPKQQEFVTDVTSVLMEADIYSVYKDDPSRVKGLVGSLELSGLNPEQTKIVLRYLNLASIL